MLELGHRPELGCDRLVPALGGADRPRAARVVRARRERVVPALSMRAPDRVDRGEVEDVEPEPLELRQHLLDAREATERAREELVPGAEASALAVDDQLERLGRERRLARQGRLGLERLVDRQALDTQKRRTLGELAGKIGLTGGDLPRELVAPRGEAVDPGRDGVLPAARRSNRERSLPAVVPDRLEGRLG